MFIELMAWTISGILENTGSFPSRNFYLKCLIQESCPGDQGLIPGPERSPGEGNGNLLQYSYLGNPMDRGAWQATVHGVAKSWTRFSDSTII